MATRLIGEFIMCDKQNQLEISVFELSILLENLRELLEPEEFRIVEFKLEDVILDLNEIIIDNINIEAKTNV